MNVQEIAVITVFFIALAYLGRMLYRNFTAKNSCGTSCKCAADFSRIEPKKD
ncbi:MAG: FeoB-associated Cys-rich membrane protein [Sphingobacteriales bacterium]|nr:FeoB-associated Cys-rich membrane protein [Sphingobacteriales bacterium]